MNSWWTASLIAQGSWSKTLTRPSDDSCRSICTHARRRTSFHLDSAPASRCADSECTAADCSRITRKLRALAALTFADRSFDRLPPRGWILVPSRTAEVVKSHQFCRSNSNWKTRVLSLIWRHSGAAMLFAKFVVGSNVVSLLAGQAGLSAARFLIYDGIGSLTWSGSYIALGYLLHGQLHWTLALTLRPLLVVRVAVFLARLWRRRSIAHAAMLVAAMVFFFSVRLVSQHNAGLRVATAFPSHNPRPKVAGFWIGCTNEHQPTIWKERYD